jgi:membrane protein
VTLVTKISDQNALIQVVSPYLLFFLKYTPFILNWILFSFIYLVLPNTTIQWRWAVFGGIIAGTLYQIVNWIYIQFQIGVAEYSAIYGSLAALPLFLVWVNLSWQIVLLGAEIAYHFELTSTNSDGTLQMVSKKYLGLAICSYCCSEFLKGKKPVTVQEIAHEIGATNRVIAFIASELFEANILALDQHGGYLPAKNPRDMTMKTIFDALEEKSLKFAIMTRGDEHGFEETLSQFDTAILNSQDNLSMNELADKLYSTK